MTTKPVALAVARILDEDRGIPMFNSGGLVDGIAKSQE